MPRKKIDHASRSHAVLSASSSHRWLACPPSAVAAELYDNTVTDFTKEGTIAHEVAEITVRAALAHKEHEPFPDETTPEMIRHAENYRDFILEHLQDQNELVLLEQKVDFSPWVPDGFGTCDCIIIRGNIMAVIDYKYGKGVEVSAEHNPQMMLYALGALNDYGFAYDVEKIEMKIYQPRIDNMSFFSMNVEDLMKWADETVKPTALKAAAGEGDYNPGENCRFCPHAGKCRALAEQCTAYVENHDPRIAVPKLAPYELAEALKWIPLLELWAKKVKDQALTDLMNGEEIPGYKVVSGRGSRKWTNEETVQGWLESCQISRASYMTEPELLSVAQLEKNLGKKWVAENLGSLVESVPGSPTIAPESDKRPAYDRLAEAKKDFGE